MSPEHAALLIGGGLVAGIVNTMAGAGSLLTVPLLHLVGLPGQLANGSNRVGVLAQCVSAALRFTREGVPGLRDALPLALPVGLGAALGAWLITFLDDLQFERLFGALMLLLVVPSIWGTQTRRRKSKAPMGRLAQRGLFLVIGVYGGAVQAGVGLPILAGLSAAGYDLVRANSIKVVLNIGLVVMALPVFLWNDLIAWPEALVLATGFAAGGSLGARISVVGGERWLRSVILLAVVALAGRMLGVY